MPDLVGLITVEMVTQVVATVAAIYLIYLFFKRSRHFPKYLIWYLILVVIWSILDYLFADSIASSANIYIKEVLEEGLADAAEQIGRSVIAAAIWVPYMLNSKKVKAVFVD